jgi:RND family efflux transporter MFP subunit
MKNSLLPLIALALLGACRKPPEATGGHMPPPQPVTLAPVEERAVVEWGEFSGRIDAVESVELRPRASGYLKEVRFKAGAMVGKDDVLFVIDSEPYDAVLDRAKGELKRAEAGATAAKKEFDRAPALLTAKAISPEQADAREAAHLQAQAGLLTAGASVRAADLDVKFCEVRSPIAGRVSRELVTAGNYVSGLPGSATLLTTIVSVDRVYVWVDMDENSFLRVQGLARDGTLPRDSEGRIEAEVQLSGESDWPHKGWIESFDNRLDAGTGSMAVRVELPNKGERLTPGLFARVRLPLTPKYPALLVDESAIRTDQSRKFVLTVDEQSLAQYRPVVLGPQHGGKRIIREGLRAGEKIIVNGHARVFMPGQPVVAEAEPPPAPTAAVAN